MTYAINKFELSKLMQNDDYIEFEQLENNSYRFMNYLGEELIVELEEEK